MSNLIGRSLGRYHILEKLGEGGMAVVYRAYDTQLERDVAVKIIRTEKLAPENLEKTLKRFEREAKALAKLSHPNIVKVIDYGNFEDVPYLVMEYIPSGTLKGMLKSNRLTFENAARMLVPIAQALGYAHRQNIVHRDVKPSNILLTNTGEPLLSDFGVARILDVAETAELTTTGFGIGTPEYMAPEQFQGGRVDGRADIYALGVVFYEMLTGRKPYQADTPAAIIWKQASEPLPRPTQFVSNLPKKVEQVIFKALAKDPKDRYQSMDDFCSALMEMTPPPKRNIEPKLKQIVSKSTGRSVGSPAQKKTILGKGKSLGLLRLSGLILLIAGLMFGMGQRLWEKGSNSITVSPVATFSSTTLPAVHLTSTSIVTETTPTLNPTKTFTPFPTSIYVDGNELFVADFENQGIGGWKFSNPVTGGSGREYWSVEKDSNENSILFAKVPAQSETLFSLGSSQWTNVVLQFRVKIGAGGRYSVTIAARMSPGATCHKRYEIGIINQFSVISFTGTGPLDNCTTKNLIIDTSTSILTDNEWHAVRLELFGPQIMLVIDDHLMGKISDSTSLSGSFQFIVAGPSSVYFDDIIVKKLTAR